MNKLIIALILLFFFLGQSVRGQEDNIKVSLMTCAPGTEIYALFGHTALRYEDKARGEDWVFNYGMFSFNAPHFIYRFVKGETDYELGVTRYPYFEGSYAMRGSSVYQQTLNLTISEKQELRRLLEENYLPENRVYRYNFFYDNCTTRARDVIERCIEGKVVYSEGKEGLSFRDIVHQYTKGHPWAQFGIDFCIGSQADHPINDRQMMFAPFYLMDAFAGARIANTSDNKALVASTKKIIDCEPDVSDSAENDIWNMLTPIRLSLLVFIAIGMATVYGLRKKKSLWGLDIAVFAAAGIAGCIIAFLALFSEHPTVGSNYLLFVFHPGHLLCLPFFINNERKRRKSRYHLLNCTVLTLFIVLFPVIPQNFDLAVLPLALCLLIRSASNLILTYKKAK